MRYNHLQGRASGGSLTDKGTSPDIYDPMGTRKGDIVDFVRKQNIINVVDSATKKETDKMILLTSLIIE